jgi:hypothetical protein
MGISKFLGLVIVFSALLGGCVGNGGDTPATSIGGDTSTAPTGGDTPTTPTPTPTTPTPVSSIQFVHPATFLSVTSSPSVQWSGYSLSAGQSYEYCIKSQPTFSCDVLNWTSVGGGTNVASQAGLSLFSGDTYYFSVRVKDGGGSVAGTVTSSGWVAYSPGRIFYIDSINGNDSFDGLVATAGGGNAGPWKTLNRINSPASGTTPKPGPNDTIMVANGTYAPVFIQSGGSAGSPMTLRAMPGANPEIKDNSPSGSWYGVMSNQATDIVIDGFKITGPITDPTNLLAAATADAGLPTPSALYNGSGIAFGSLAPANPATFPKNIVIRRNTVSGWGGGGISAIQTDYVKIIDNVIYNNCWYNRYANSAISLYGSRDADNNTTTYRNVIQRNKVFNNYTQVAWGQISQVSDGNGIIIDDFQHTQAFNKNDSSNGYFPYSGKTLISDNLVVGNGGSGIHTYLSDNVDIVRNTSYMNSLKVDYGEIFANSSKNILIAENIMVGRSSRKLSKDSSSTNVTRNNNLFYGSGAINSPPGGTIAANMGQIGFVNASFDVQNSDFTLLNSSLAVNIGASSIDSITRFDIRMKSRPVGGASDIGAYESQ